VVRSLQSCIIYYSSEEFGICEPITYHTLFLKYVTQDRPMLVPLWSFTASGAASATQEDFSLAEGSCRVMRVEVSPPTQDLREPRSTHSINSGLT
jgi:hypothetical protein